MDFQPLILAGSWSQIHFEIISNPFVFVWIVVKP